MPRSNSGPTGRTLVGGRAYYKGHNAYASQGFENDTRQQTLGSLAMLYLWGQQAIPNGMVDTTVIFNTGYASAGFQPIFTRGFRFNPPEYALYCQTTGTYAFHAALRGLNLTHGKTLIMRIKIQRGIDEFQLVDAHTNTSTGLDGDFTVLLSGIIDLRSSDRIILTAATDSSTVVLDGGAISTSTAGGVLESLAPTFLQLEQLDVV